MMLLDDGLTAAVMTTSTVVDTAALHITLLTAGEQHVVNVGDSLTLDCHFHAVNYNLFDYPVLWRKHQLNDAVQINVMGNINEPFLAGHRFEVTFSAAASGPASPASTYSLQLSISGQSDLTQRPLVLCTPSTVFFSQ